jgi:hypothetical protein
MGEEVITCGATYLKMSRPGKDYHPQAPKKRATTKSRLGLILMIHLGVREYVNTDELFVGVRQLDAKNATVRKQMGYRTAGDPPPDA